MPILDCATDTNETIVLQMRNAAAVFTAADMPSPSYAISTIANDFEKTGSFLSITQRICAENLMRSALDIQLNSD